MLKKLYIKLFKKKTFEGSFPPFAEKVGDAIIVIAIRNRLKVYGRLLKNVVKYITCSTYRYYHASIKVK